MPSMQDTRYSDVFALYRWKVLAVAMILFACAFSTGCSLRQMAINKLGDVLASGGTTYASDDDLELIEGAVPFSLKLIESLLAESPRHKGLLLAACRGFTQYSYAFVQQEADEVEETDVDRAMEMRARARRLYLRARDYGLRGLEVVQPGFQAMARDNPSQSVQAFKPADTALIYWTAASWASAISVTKDDADLIADLPVVEALIYRALHLDETFEGGAIHSFLIAYEMNRQTASGDPEERARGHFNKAMEFSEGRLCGPLVTLAESVSLPKQDRVEFTKLLQRALEIDPDAKPEWRLANTVVQRRARWLLGRADKLFLD